ncbi:NAD-dependent epimerase/dehydratase family protein [Halolamina sp.]|jgi:UDP-glucose 4-epimerase|uniref:NAD-dependent epimerase/dehydratase family protein n=1 Tax=Halolamina sp. TaxID=1940283 RepID=UPI000223BD12|nr:NAD-dependent epimerase/dehydratase [halophilic archaeon DL31]
MHLENQKIVVTGAAGLVGSQLTADLVEENDVRAVDDLSKGAREAVPDKAQFVQADMLDPVAVDSVITETTDIVFHFAAHTDVRVDDPEAERRVFEENTKMTYNVVERMREVGCDHLAFTSSSTVYGEAPRPTPEGYGPLEPISIYGASKLSDEGVVSTFANSYGIQSWVFRFANIVGPRQRGNVIPDFIQKLQDDPEMLTILGNGKQEKSYLHVADCVEAIQYVVEHGQEDYNLYNLGSRTTTSVIGIADIVADVMDLDPAYEFTGGDRGWTGDVPKMRLDTDKLVDLGYDVPEESDAAVRRATEELYEELRS